MSEQRAAPRCKQKQCNGAPMDAIATVKGWAIWMCPECEVIVTDEVLHCPKCGRQHLDVDTFAFRPHRTHRCENTPYGRGTGCGHEWTPLTHYTRGVMAQ